jgi:hypothetical protein
MRALAPEVIVESGVPEGRDRGCGAARQGEPGLRQVRVEARGGGGDQRVGGFNGALQLYVLMRALAPEVIVESGVFRGLTTWVMSR